LDAVDPELTTRFPFMAKCQKARRSARTCDYAPHRDAAHGSAALRVGVFYYEGLPICLDKLVTSIIAVIAFGQNN
jgi:hypothetical protein